MRSKVDPSAVGLATFGLGSMDNDESPALFANFGGAALGGAAFWRLGRVLGYTR
jgi:hypothetical protein